MSVANKTIRELEDVAAKTVRTMYAVAAYMDGEGHGGAARTVRLAAVELDLAETNCARERITTMSEADQREEFLALGWSWDIGTDGFENLQRLIAEHDAREKVARGHAAAATTMVEASTTIGDPVGGLVAGPKSELSYWYDLIEKDAMAAEAFPLAPDHGLKLTVLDVPPDTSGPMPFVRRPDPELLDLPIGHPSGGLGDGGKSDREAWDEQVRHMQRSILGRPVSDVPPDTSGKAVVRLDAPPRNGGSTSTHEDDEGEYPDTFVCDVCNSEVPVGDGGDDDMPGACAACWCAAHPKAAADVEAMRECKDEEDPS